MQDRTIACGLATHSQTEQNLLANISAEVTNEILLLYRAAEEINAEPQSSHNHNALQNDVPEQSERDYGTLLLSNFANYQSVIEQKIMSATENLSSNGDVHEVPHIEKIPQWTSANSQYQDSNLLDNLTIPILQQEKKTQQGLQCQFQTGIQSKLNQDLTTQQIEKEIYRKKEQIQFQKGTPEPSMGDLIIFTQTEYSNQQEMVFRSHASHGLPTQNIQLDLFSNDQGNPEQKLAENIIERNIEQRNFQMVAENEPRQYSLNSDNLLGIIQDNITNTQAPTQFRFKNQLENEFDFSQYAQIRLDEKQDETSHLLNQEIKQPQNVQDCLMQLNQRSFEENNNNLSLEININSDSKQNIILERRQLSACLTRVEDDYEDIPKENDFIVENLFQNLQQEMLEKSQEGNIPLEKTWNQTIEIEDQPICMENNSLTLQKGQQTRSQQQKSQVTFRARSQDQNQHHRKMNVLNWPPPQSEQKVNFQIVCSSELILQPTSNKNIEEIEHEIRLASQALPIQFDQILNAENLEKQSFKNQSLNNQFLQQHSQINIQKIFQPHSSNVQPETIVLQQTNQVIQLIQTSINSQNLEGKQIEVVENHVQAARQENLYQHDTSRIGLIVQRNDETFTTNLEVDLKTNQVREQKQSQVEHITKQIQRPNLKQIQSQSQGKDKKMRREQNNQRDLQELHMPSINIYNSYETNHQQKQTKNQHIQLAPSNFINFNNLQPCISININRDNQISLNLFRTYPHNLNNFEARNNDENWERKQKPNLIQKVILDANNNNSKQRSEVLRDMRSQKKQLSETAVQTIINQNETTQNKKDLPSQNPKDQNQEFQCQKQSIDQRLNRIRKIADQYMMADIIQQPLHKQFENILKAHVLIRFSPQPLDDFGRELFKDGLVVVAMVKMLSRSSKTPFLLNYIFQYLQSAFTIEFNSYLFNQESKKAKANFQKYLVENYEKNINQQQTKELKPVKRTIQPLDSQIIQRKLRFQSNNIAINQNNIIQTRRKSKDLGFSVEKLNFFVQNNQINNNSLNQKQSLTQKKKEVHNSNLKQVQKIPSKPLESRSHTTDFSLKLEDGKKDNENRRIIQKQKTEKVQVVMQQESPSNSLQEIDDNNFKQSLENPNETRLTENQYEDKSSKTQKANKSKYADLKMNSLQKNECAKQVEACLQNRNNKFNQLYEKYKKIRENKKSDSFLPSPSPTEDKIAPLSKSVLPDSKEKDLGPEKKKNKHVQFLDEPMELRKEEGEVEGQEEGIKLKKRKKTKKSDNQANEEQEQISKMKRSRK